MATSVCCGPALTTRDFSGQTDQKQSLLDRLDLLRHVTFQKDLGSYYEKTQRVQRLCSWLSEIVKQAESRFVPA